MDAIPFELHFLSILKPRNATELFLIHGFTLGTKVQLGGGENLRI
jgi:hypothetical protein